MGLIMEKCLPELISGCFSRRRRRWMSGEEKKRKGREGWIELVSEERWKGRARRTDGVWGLTLNKQQEDKSERDQPTLLARPLALFLLIRRNTIKISERSRSRSTRWRLKSSPSNLFTKNRKNSSDFLHFVYQLFISMWSERIRIFSLCWQVLQFNDSVETKKLPDWTPNVQFQIVLLKVPLQQLHIPKICTASVKILLVNIKHKCF